MINAKRMIGHPTLAAGVAVLALVAGCGSGPVQSDNASDSASTEQTSSVPQINDPAVEAAALRTVDACALLGDLGELGTVVPDSVSSTDWGDCSVEVTDSGGKTVELVLYVGDNLILSEDPTSELEGLPLVIDDEDAESCWVSVVTSYELSLGITFQVKYPGGDGCAAGQTALGKVVQTLHGDPPQYQQVAGSVLAADPCAVADKATVETALGQKSFMEVQSLHECNFWSGDGTSYPLVTVRLYKGLPPEDGEPADLGGGVTAIQAKDEDTVISCDVSWLKVETPSEDEAEGYGEIVSVMVSGEAEDGLDTASACEKGVAVAKTVVPSLG